MNSSIANISSSYPVYSSPSHLSRPPLSPHISDFHLSLVLPVLAYWSLSLLWAIVSHYDLFSTYRIHTPAELETRNRATVREVLRSVIFQQIIQTAWGLFLGHVVLGTQDVVVSAEYDIAVWADRVGKGISWLNWSLRMGIMALGFDLSRSKSTLHVPFYINIATLVCQLPTGYYL